MERISIHRLKLQLTTRSKVLVRNKLEDKAAAIKTGNSSEKGLEPRVVADGQKNSSVTIGTFFRSHLKSNQLQSIIFFQEAVEKPR
jgi:hypothetical protein